MTHLIVWRHGQTDWNANGRVQGTRDVDLNPTGVEQTRAAAARLAEREPTRIFSSDLRRAARAADELSALTGLPIQFDTRLRERAHGPWEGLHRDEIRDRFPQDFIRWNTNQEIQTPGVESVDDLGNRVAAALIDAVAANPGGTIVVATHGAAARAGCAAVLGWPTGVWRTMAILGNSRVTELRFSEPRGWQLQAHNAG